MQVLEVVLRWYGEFAPFFPHILLATAYVTAALLQNVPETTPSRRTSELRKVRKRRDQELAEFGDFHPLQQVVSSTAVSMKIPLCCLSPYCSSFARIKRRRVAPPPWICSPSRSAPLCKGKPGFPLHSEGMEGGYGSLIPAGRRRRSSAPER